MIQTFQKFSKNHPRVRHPIVIYEETTGWTVHQKYLTFSNILFTAQNMLYIYFFRKAIIKHRHKL